METIRVRGLQLLQTLNEYIKNYTSVNDYKQKSETEFPLNINPVIA